LVQFQVVYLTFWGNKGAKENYEIGKRSLDNRSFEKSFLSKIICSILSENHFYCIIHKIYLHWHLTLIFLESTTFSSRPINGKDLNLDSVFHIFSGFNVKGPCQIKYILWILYCLKWHSWRLILNFQLLNPNLIHGHGHLFFNPEQKQVPNFTL